LQDIASIIVTFPDVLGAFGAENAAEKLLVAIPDAAFTIIDQGLVTEHTRQEVEGLPFGVQVTILYSILRETVPGGFGPFAEILTELIDAINRSELGKAQLT